jgi:hypothetical protein
MSPHPDLIKILKRNKCKVLFKVNSKTSMGLWIKYNDLINSKPATDFTVYGNAQQAFENVAAVVRRYYPTAELSSQDGRGSVVYTINNITPTPPPPAPPAAIVNTNPSKRK